MSDDHDRLKALAYKLAARDYEAVLGTTLEVFELFGYGPGATGWAEHFEASTMGDIPFRVRVIATDESDVERDGDEEWVDPYWNVEVVEEHPDLPPLASISSAWVDGKSYSIFELTSMEILLAELGGVEDEVMIKSIVWQCDCCGKQAHIESKSGRREVPEGWSVSPGDHREFCGEACMQDYQLIVATVDREVDNYRRERIRGLLELKRAEALRAAMDKCKEAFQEEPDGAQAI